MVTKLKVKEFYDAIAQEYVDSYTKHPKGNAILKKYERLLPRKARILDIGCGPGFPIDTFLAKGGHKITGIDISKEMIKYAKKFVKKGKFMLGDIRKIRLPENYYGGIISSFSLVHMSKKDAKESLRKIYDLLRNNGILYLSLVEKEGEKVMTWFRKTTKCVYFREKEIKNILEKIGFKVVYLERYALKRKGKRPQMQLFIFAKK